VSTLEDTLRVTLRIQAETADLVGGHGMLARVHRHGERTRRRLRTSIAAVAATAVVISGSWWVVGELGQVDDVAAPGYRAAHWADLSWQVPAGWQVNDAHADARHYRSDDMVEGPFMGTGPTGPICRTTASGWECARALGITERPADGVIAWVMAGRILNDAGTDVDPGPTTDGICGGSLSGTPFHAYRVIRSLSGGARVALDGCVYGPHQGELLAELKHLSDSVEYHD